MLAVEPAEHQGRPQHDDGQPGARRPAFPAPSCSPCTSRPPRNSRPRTDSAPRRACPARATASSSALGRRHVVARERRLVQPADLRMREHHGVGAVERACQPPGSREIGLDHRDVGMQLAQDRECSPGACRCATMFVQPRALSRGIRFCPTSPAAPVTTIFMRVDAFSASELSCDGTGRRGRRADDHHHAPPEPRRVDDVAAPRRSPARCRRRPVGRRPERAGLVEGGRSSASSTKPGRMSSTCTRTRERRGASPSRKRWSPPLAAP